MHVCVCDREGGECMCVVCLREREGECVCVCMNAYACVGEGVLYLRGGGGAGMYVVGRCLYACVCSMCL